MNSYIKIEKGRFKNLSEFLQKNFIHSTHILFWWNKWKNCALKGSLI